MNKASKQLAGTMSVASIALLIISLWWSIEYDKYRTIAIVVAFVTLLPSIVGLVWFFSLYDGSSLAKVLMSIFSIASFVILPAAVYWGAQYDSASRARTLPFVIALCDMIPFFAGMFWFAHLQNQASKKKAATSGQRVVVPYYAIPFVIFLIFCQYLVHRHR